LPRTHGNPQDAWLSQLLPDAASVEGDQDELAQVNVPGRRRRDNFRSASCRGLQASEADDAEDSTDGQGSAGAVRGPATGSVDVLPSMARAPGKSPFPTVKLATPTAVVRQTALSGDALAMEAVES